MTSEPLEGQGSQICSFLVTVTQAMRDLGRPLLQPPAQSMASSEVRQHCSGICPLRHGKRTEIKTTFTEQPAPVLDCPHGQNASAHIQSESLTSIYACRLSSSHIQCCKELGSPFSVNSFCPTAIPWSLLFSRPNKPSFLPGQEF